MTGVAGIIDLHSHLVPGVDDGAETLEGALEGIGRMGEAGVAQVVTTPHFDASLGRDPRRFHERLERIDEGFADLRRGVAEQYPGIVVKRGQEVMLDDPFPDLSDPRLRLAGTRFVLVEWPRLRIPPSTPDVVARIRGAGWVPLIAHPERYADILRDFRVVAAWRRAGACLQMNHGSLVGRYGDRAQAAAFRLLAGGWVDVLSTDFHGRSHLPTYVDAAREWFEEQGQHDIFEILTVVNPGRILADEHPEAVPSFEMERGLWDRITALFRHRDA